MIFVSFVQLSFLGGCCEICLHAQENWRMLNITVTRGKYTFFEIVSHGPT